MKRIEFCHLIDVSTPNPLLYSSIKHSDKDRFEYTVISHAAEGQLQKQMEELGVESFSLNCFSRKKYLLAILRLCRILRREKFDAIQVHSFEASLIGLVAATLAGIPVRIFSGHHSHEVPLYGNRRLMALDSFLARRLATRVIAPSKNMKDIFIAEHKVPAAKIEVIEHGIDLDDWRNQAAQRSDLRGEFGFGNKVVFGAVGRLFWVKGFETLIRAFAAVAEQHEEIVLAIAGEGADRPLLETLIAQLGMGQRIKLVGKRTDIGAVMNEFDVLIHPSIAESFGLIYPEAFALGKPIIATRGGIAEDIVRDGVNGFLINAGSVSEMIEAIEKMIDLKPSWAKMGDDGRDTAERFSVIKTQAKYDQFISTLVQK